MTGLGHRKGRREWENRGADHQDDKHHGQGREGAESARAVLPMMAGVAGHTNAPEPELSTSTTECSPMLTTSQAELSASCGDLAVKSVSKHSQLW